MIPADDFVKALKQRSFRFFTGVPCSFFQSAINRVIEDPELRYTMVPNEGSALALAAGSYLAGRTAVVMIQNSGFGNLINPLTSLNQIYKLPALILISGRAYGIPDEPQHEIMGRAMSSILDSVGVHYKDLPAEKGTCEKALGEAERYLKRQKLPFVFFVKKGTLESAESKIPAKNPYPLKRLEAIQLIVDSLEGDEYLIATTGKPSRELFSVADRKKNFYMQGSMGHASALALGVALNQPEKKIVVLDGDGAVLMHMGILSSIGHCKPANLYHIVLDNEAYESTGNQDTTSATTDLVKVAKACGYTEAEEVISKEDLQKKLKQILKGKGPAFLRVKVNRLVTPNVPRITSKYTSEEIASGFKLELTP